MHEVIKKTYELLDCLDSSDMIKGISKYKAMIENNDELQKLIHRGKNTDDKYILLDIRNQLYQYDEYKKYMHYYNELMYIVMEINHRYKKLLDERSCINQ